jgi:hypothetical protein
MKDLILAGIRQEYMRVFQVQFDFGKLVPPIKLSVVLKRQLEALKGNVATNTMMQTLNISDDDIRKCICEAFTLCGITIVEDV